MRIRTIKPEFFRSPDTAKTSFAARLFYQALWCWADDFGIGESNLNGLLGFAFCDEDNFSAQDLRRFCAEVARNYGVTFYTVRGRHYYAIPTWEKHQKLERRTERRKHPSPDDPDALPDLRIYDGADSAPDLRREPGAESGENGAGTGEQGNRGKGTGEQKTSSAEPTVRPTKYPPEFETFWKAYPRKVAKEAALKAWLKARRRAPIAEIQAGAERLAADPNLPDQNFIPHPATWLSRGSWTDPPYPPPKADAKPSTTDQRVQAGLDLMSVYAEREREEQRLEIEA